MGKQLELQSSMRWAEFWAIFLIILGFMFAVSIDNPVLAYIIALLMGAIMGRLLWRFKKNLKGSIITIILGFLVGFLLGIQAADRKVIIALFVLGLVVSFYVHDRNIIRGAEY